MTSTELTKALRTDPAHAWLHDPVVHLAPGGGVNRYKVDAKAVEDIKSGCLRIYEQAVKAEDGDLVVHDANIRIFQELEEARNACAEKLLQTQIELEEVKAGMAEADKELKATEAALILVSEELKATCAKHDLHHDEPAVSTGVEAPEVQPAVADDAVGPVCADLTS